MAKKKAKRKRKSYPDDRNDPNRGDGLNDRQREAQRRFHDNDSLGGETGRYLDSIRGTSDDPGE